MIETIADDLSEKIREQCLGEKAVVAAYIFGSYVAGKMKSGSDIDVAILVEPGHEDDFRVLDFAVVLERLCGYTVDLVLLNRAGELLKFHVRRYGKLIFERDSRIRKRFEVMGRKRYEDFLYLHSRYVSSVIYKKAAI